MEMLEVVRCPECDGYFGESGEPVDGVPNIVQHCVEEHPDSLIARVVALAGGAG